MKKFFAVILLVSGLLGLYPVVGQMVYNTNPGPKPKLFKEMFHFDIGFGYDIHGGDMGDRFGNALKFSLGAGYLFESGIEIGAEVFSMFGSNVREDVLSIYRNPAGNVYGTSNDVADVFLRYRGLYVGPYISKVFSSGLNRSGFRLGLGAGVLQHRIRLLDDTNSFAQIFGDYRKGYDRLTRGFAIKESIGYQIHSDDGLVNMNIQLEFIQGFTNQVRKVNFDNPSLVPQSRLEHVIGLRVTWFLPISKSDGQEVIYY